MDNKLRQLRKERKLTQVELQMRTGIEQSLLSKFENGERVPPTETLIALADFYHVSIDYILCRTENPQINKNRSSLVNLRILSPAKNVINANMVKIS